MATKGYVQSIVNRLDAKIKAALIQAFDYVLDNLRIGPVDVDQNSERKAENFRWYRFDATTPSTANTEFSIDHALNMTPTNVIPFLPVGSTGYQVVRLRVPRAADERRVYLQSSETNALVAILIEV